ncbi:MAG: hypothetical protein JW917_11610 [Ignavibacteria bacterium]|nr:hypothetical protein [Ignavibacteria bacterium]
MFEDLIQRKIKEEKAKAKFVMVFSTEGIAKSDLSLFTKGFVNIDTKGENINPESLNQLIEKSIKLCFNYTLRPKWTLLNYIFGNFESVSTSTVLRKLEIFRFYKFYEESVRKYVKEKNPLALTKKIIVKLFDDADTVLHDRLLTEPSAVKTKNFFLQLFRLKYDENTNLSLNSSIPFGYIRIFLEDKSFYGLLENFSVIKKLHDGKEIELKDIIKIISGRFVMEQKPLQDIAVESNKNVVFSESNFDYLTPSEEMNKTFEEKSTVVEENSKPQDKTENDVSNIEILKLFSREDSEKILKKIFLNNKIRMYEAMNEISSLENWDEAADYLKSVFLENKVDIYHKDVVLFVDVINEYFNKRNG